ncbi:2-hydroxyglutaryl-CoA dehydratase [bacterium]|nr:2-hydroxyglutaryl-CoA dehydratase [bacterium]
MKNGENIFCGIDIGSRTGKIVLIESSKTIIFSKIIKTVASAVKTYNALVETIPEELKDAVSASAVTGYGRESTAAMCDFSATEITCHYLGVLCRHPETKTIIDIGGQDSKVITIDNHGRIKDFAMNDRCAAGTGRFLEVMTDRIGFSIEDFAALDVSEVEPVKINSTCTVFAESEVISMVARDIPQNVIASSLARMVAANTFFMARKTRPEAPFFMSGGVSKLKPVRFHLEKLFGFPIKTDNNSQLMGALGAALFAKKQSV